MLVLQNGTTNSAHELVDKLNKADLPSSVGKGLIARHHPCVHPCTLSTALSSYTVHAEVVVAPAFVHIPLVQSNLRREIAVSAQNCWIKGNGAYTGEVRWVHKLLVCSCLQGLKDSCIAVANHVNTCKLQYACLTSCASAESAG